MITHLGGSIGKIIGNPRLRIIHRIITIAGCFGWVVGFFGQRDTNWGACACLQSDDDAVRKKHGEEEEREEQERFYHKPKKENGRY